MYTGWRDGGLTKGKEYIRAGGVKGWSDGGLTEGKECIRAGGMEGWRSDGGLNRSLHHLLLGRT